MAYRRRFDDNDVDNMQQDAAAAEKITDAERRMALAGNRTNNLNNQRADIAAAAHERRMASRARFIESNPNAVNPWERQSTLGYARQQNERRQLQEHERGMLGDKIKGEVDVAHEKRLGMENQGVEVGKLRYGYTDYDGKYHEGSEERIARQQGQNALSLAEKEWAGKKEIADIGLKQHELEWGEGGGRERVAKIEGSSRVGAAEAQAKAVAEQNAQKNALEEQKRIAAAEKEKGRLKLQYDKLEQKDKAAVDTQANALAKEKGIGFEDARDQIMAAREQQNAGPQEGATRTLSSGRKVVYRGGQWQYAD